MTEKSRRDLIEAFLATQDYIVGALARVRFENDIPVIEFKKMSEAQLFRLRNAFRENDLAHIQVRPLELVPDAPRVPPVRYGKRRRRYSSR